MHASETNLQSIIEGTKQYVVPLFQRAYSWTQKEWTVLWEDLLFLCSNEEPKSHFIGSIVTMPTVSVPQGSPKFLLIDGQQRLTTIFILLALVRDVAREDGKQNLADEINHTMLVNPYKTALDYYKLLPTQSDRPSFQAIIQKQELNQDSQLSKCYHFLNKQIKRGLVGIDKLHTVISSRLSVVSIVLNSDDNPHLVFESLNAKGRPLTQADLIRNYFFMRIHVDEQEARHAELWQPMQESLGEELPEFIRHYLMKEGGVVKQSDVYLVLKERVDRQNAITALEELVLYANYYEKLIYPEKETNLQLRQALADTKRLEVTTVYPFLLNCYHDYSQNALSQETFLEILSTLENFIIRRFICYIPTNSLNKTFPILYRQAKLRHSRNLLLGIRSELHTREYPKDSEFHKHLLESKLYGSGERRKKTKYVLEKLETAFLHKEKVEFSNLQVEHVMPQTLKQVWQQQLGENWQVEHETYLHTLGNLTLTAYNAELSNAPFAEKKRLFQESHLELNKYFQHCENWNSQEIHKRSKNLADLAIKIWPHFGSQQSLNISEKDVTGQTPRLLIFLEQEIEVDSWRDVLVETVKSIIELDPSSFQSNIQIQLSKFINSNPASLRSSRPLSNGYFVEVHLSAKDIYKLCLQCLELANLSLQDWNVRTK
ncbi:MAG: DUF262 domain-containing protein [Spirochaetota bacterium]